MLLYTHCDCIVATTTVPSGPPQNFTVMTNSNFHLLLTWSPPLLSQRNGVIIFYAVSARTKHASVFGSRPW